MLNWLDFSSVVFQPYLKETFGLKLFSIKNIQRLLMVVIYGKIWVYFWNVRFSLSQENWGQRRLMCEKVGILGKRKFSLNINFLLDSILFLFTMVNFQLKVAKNWDLSFSNLEKFLMQQRSRTPVESWLSKIWNGQISFFGHF